jgi:hypothetical protein
MTRPSHCPQSNHVKISVEVWKYEALRHVISIFLFHLPWIHHHFFFLSFFQSDVKPKQVMPASQRSLPAAPRSKTTLAGAVYL